MILGQIELDPSAYPNGGSRMEVVTTAEDAPDDLAAIVRPLLCNLVRGQLHESGVAIGAIGCGCSDKPDSRVKGARALIAHYETCSDFAAQVRAFQTHPVRAATWGKSIIAYAIKTGDVLPKFTGYPAPPTVEQLAPCIEDAKRGVTVAGAYAFVAVSTEVNDLPELLVAARKPMAGFATRRGIVAVQYLGAATTRLREAVEVFMASEKAASLHADAQRVGAVIVLGHEGRPIVERQPDLRDRIRELEDRLAALEQS
jgi:hypothetical protein